MKLVDDGVKCFPLYLISNMCVQKALLIFTCDHFLSFSFPPPIYFCNLCVLATPRRASAFDFSLKNYVVNFLSHSSEMEKFKNYHNLKECFYTVSSYCLLLITA